MTRSQANLLLLAVAIVWGSAFVAQAHGMDGVEPFTFTGLRFLLGVCVVAPLALRDWRKIQARTLQEDVPLQILQSVVAPTTTPEDATQAEQLLEHLSVSLGQLSARQQQIFILSRLHGCSYQEIADQLGVSLSTVQKELKLIMAICIGVADRLNRP